MFAHTVVLRCARKLVLPALVLFATAADASGAMLTVRVSDSVSNAPLEDTVVSVSGALNTVLQTTQAPVAVMEQRNQQFDPRLLVIATGTAVEFPNRDRTRHHVYSFSRPKTFEIRLYNGLPAEPILFDTAGPVALGCNIHDQMQAHIYVTDAAQWKQTGASGEAQLALAETASQVTLEFWHPRLRGEVVTRVLTAPFPESLALQLDVRPPLPRQREPESSLQRRFDQLIQ